MKLDFNNTYPVKNDKFWQIEILPNLWILHGYNDYIVIGIAWLFWSIDLTINYKEYGSN